jgi:hypothetical protein
MVAWDRAKIGVERNLGNKRSAGGVFNPFRAGNERTRCTTDRMDRFFIGTWRKNNVKNRMSGWISYGYPVLRKDMLRANVMAKCQG